MAHQISIDSAHNLVGVRAWGAVSFEEFLEYRASISNSLGLRANLRLLIDLRQAEFTPTADQIRLLTAETPYTADARIAVLVSDDLHFGLARMWAVISERTSGQLHPFRALEEACEWIGVSPEDAVALISP